MLGGLRDSRIGPRYRKHASTDCQIFVDVRAGGELRPAGAGVCDG